MADFNPYQTPNAYVEDVAGEVEGELAGRGTRLGAALIDGMIIMLIAWLMWYLFVPGMFSKMMTGYKPPILLSLTVGLSTLVVWIAINFSLLARSGQTVGKKILGIKIVCTDNTPCNVWRIAGRRFLIPGLIGQVPIAGIFFSLVDVLFIFRESRRCIHDLIADTIVIRA